MEKMGRSTWAKLQKQPGVVLKKQQTEQSNEIEEDFTGENLDLDNSVSKILRLQRIEDADEDAPNQFIDEEAYALRQKMRNRLQVDENRVDRAIKESSSSSQVNFIDDEYDPNEPFSEFKFRSFKKDRQVK